MEDLKINTKTLCKISLAINKMEISKKIIDLNVETGNEEADKAEVGRQLVALIIDNFYKAEDEIVDLIAMLKGITKEEAEEVDVISVIRELLSNEKVKSFLNFQ